MISHTKLVLRDFRWIYLPKSIQNVLTYKNFPLFFQQSVCFLPLPFFSLYLFPSFPSPARVSPRTPEIVSKNGSTTYLQTTKPMYVFENDFRFRFFELFDVASYQHCIVFSGSKSVIISAIVLQNYVHITTTVNAENSSLCLRKVL